ncbi:hypothetical protein EUGRSUZ_G00421 [Eucalyptus grandis]|uniref:Uncharacterized protein n=2 Tax=Eucalyptus grandis TaxID=71139 RepID=A0ACC3K1G7_EUCGR|nr:hypothetical protein EUGRSUZ_G00421 [Eucalyptus grandis]
MYDTCHQSTCILFISFDTQHSRLIYKSYCLNLIDPSSVCVCANIPCTTPIATYVLFLGVFTGHYYLE